MCVVVPVWVGRTNTDKPEVEEVEGHMFRVVVVVPYLALVHLHTDHRQRLMVVVKRKIATDDAGLTNSPQPQENKAVALVFHWSIPPGATTTNPARQEKEC